MLYPPELPTILALAPLLLVVGLTAPLHWVLLIDLVLFPILPGLWTRGGPDVAGLRLDPTTIAYSALLAGIVLRAPGLLSRQRIRHLGLWVLLGLCMSISYVSVPVNEYQMRNPFLIPYFLYRYIWLTILPFVLVGLLMTDMDKYRKLFTANIAVGVFFVFSALPQVFAGRPASGPYISGNAFGAVLLLPILAALGLFLEGRRRFFPWLLVLASLLFMSRYFLFTRARGAFVGLMVAASIMVLSIAFRRPAGTRLARGVAVGCLVMFIATLVKGNLLERPNVRTMMSAREGTDARTMEWRLESRWPYFWEKAMNNPLVGTGEIADDSFGTRGAFTPHNGYLALAVMYGLPTAVLFCVFGILGMVHGFRLFWIAPEPEIRMMGLVCACGIVALLIHATVDSIPLTPLYTMKQFFILCGVAASLWSQRKVLARVPAEVVTQRPAVA